MRIATAEPQTASRGLQFTGFTPIQPLPTIKEVTAMTQQLTQQVLQPTTETPKPASPQAAETSTLPDPENQLAGTGTPPASPESTAPTETTMPQNSTETPDPEPVTATDSPADEPQSEAEEPFAECWTGMVDAIFQKKPAFYHQLRDYLPRYENDVIYVEVENDFQKNQLEMSKRAMLEFWRAHYKLNVNEMEFVIHEHERKKVIYTSEDKVNNMLEQNPELKDFLQVLNFRIKD